MVERGQEEVNFSNVYHLEQCCYDNLIAIPVKVTETNNLDYSLNLLDNCQKTTWSCSVEIIQVQSYSFSVDKMHRGSIFFAVCFIHHSCCLWQHFTQPNVDTQF